MNCPRKTKTFINSQDGFFHYEPLSTSFFSKNLIIPEAVIFSKSYSVTKIINYTFYIAIIKNCLKFYSLDAEDVKGKKLEKSGR